MSAAFQGNTVQRIMTLESRLRDAMLSSDVAELDALIDDRLLFVGPDGGVYSKADDLALHRSGATRVHAINVEESRVELHDGSATVVVTASLAGEFHGAAFSGRFRYLRVWACTKDTARIVAGSVCALAESVPD
jgi:Domain of unknown function (DUF4440)